jgi:carbonic anhydrase
VLTCMDARIHPEKALGLEVGDAHVLRNAGGRVTEDVLRSLMLSTHVLGTRTLLVIHHTGCGLYGEEDDVRAAVAAAGGNVEAIDFDAFSDLEGSVREDIERLRSSRRVSEGVEVRGFIYNVETGSLHPVEQA